MRPKIRRYLVFLILILITTFSTIACQNDNSTQGIKIGSKDFAEQFILGEMYAQTLEAQGYEVERNFNLGGTPVAHEALQQGEIDFYPEYVGTALLTVLKESVISDRQEAYNTVAENYEQQYDLIWLEPSPMNNSQVLVTTEETAAEYQLENISDLVEKASNLTMIGPPEFQVREDGLPGLKEAYGDFNLEEYRAVDPGLRYQGLLNQEADIAVGFATDGEISQSNLVVLEDNLNFFPPYPVAPVLRQELLTAKPEIEAILNQLTQVITDEVMRDLNYQVTGENKEPEAVAQEFLQSQNFLEE